MKAVFYTAEELAARGSDHIPPELVSNTHLIYSSPATLAFNSPGAEGYGVKRAGLAVPGSVMLIISPGCCGRNTSAISRMPGYEDRFFYLTMNETDLVTGRHLKKIPKAVAEICRGLEEQGKRPRVVMLCITCVDALLGTDMERICRRAEEKVTGVRVAPCYMYALTREGRKPPMVHVRQSIYALLTPRRKRASSVNLLGFFAPLQGSGPDKKDTDGYGSELFALLQQAGVRRIRQIGACRDYDAFQEMAEANFNLVLNPEARPAAYDLQERLGIPFIEISRFYQIDRIEAQYAALGRVLQTGFDDTAYKAEALAAVEDFRRRYPDAVFSVGEAMNGNPFELACALVREGFAVREIFGTVSKDSYVWLDILARLSPHTRIYSNLHPTMLHYGSEGSAAPQEKADAGTLSAAGGGHDEISRSEGDGTDGAGSRSDAEGRDVTISIGRDAAWYHPDIPNVQWITDVQPFGYRAVTGLFRALADAMENRTADSYRPDITLGAPGASAVAKTVSGDPGPVSADLRAAEGQTEEEILVRERGTETTEEAAEEILEKTAEETEPAESREDGAADAVVSKKQKAVPPVGFRRFTTPFAPDQSGAVSVLYDMDGICVICDAGGCTGNICGFDEPRWFGHGRRSAVFSAGLRDMDAILGRDDRLVEKLADAAEQIPAEFAAIVGTPVPAVIGTDYRALCRMATNKTGLPVLGVNSDGMEYYDRGMEKTYLALLETFCRPDAEGVAPADDLTGDPADHPSADPFKAPADAAAFNNAAGEEKESAADETPILGIWGYSPLDYAGILSEQELRQWAEEQGYARVLCPGAGTSVEDLKKIGRAQKNLVLSPAGAAAAKWLEKQYGTPWEYCIPRAEQILEKTAGDLAAADSRPCGKSEKVLVVHQQTLARALCGLLLEKGIRARAAGFFLQNPEEDFVDRLSADRISSENFSGRSDTSFSGRSDTGFFSWSESGLSGHSDTGFSRRSGTGLSGQADPDFSGIRETHLREETDLRTLVQEEKISCVIADRSLAPILAGLPVRVIHLPHFAVSGELGSR